MFKKTVQYCNVTMRDEDGKVGSPSCCEEKLGFALKGALKVGKKVESFHLYQQRS